MKNKILKPRNLEGRKEMLKQYNIKFLSQEEIKGDLIIIDKTFEEIPEDLVKVKEIHGDVILAVGIGSIPSWLKDVKIFGYFDCSDNNLTSLENCPQYIDGYFNCMSNNLTSLECCPKYIGENLFCMSNKKILHLPEGVELKGKLFT